MDWNLAIERNREALKRVLAMLVAMAGLGGGAALTSPLWGGRPSPDGRVGVIGALQPPPDASRRPPHKGEVKAAFMLPRHLHRAVLRLLRPAESATRRLVIVAAREIVVTLPPVRPPAQKHTEPFTPPPPRIRSAPPPASRVADGSQAERPSSPPGTGGEVAREARRRGGENHGRLPRPANRGVENKRTSPRKFAFPLFDPLRRMQRLHRPAARSIPRISVPGFSEPFPVPVRRPPAPDDLIDATRLVLRLAALGRALDDLPQHARRFARWQARRDAALYPPPCGEGRRATEAERGIARRGGGTAIQAPRPAASRRRWPLRAGRPPGQRPRNTRRPAHEVHEVLADLHWFATRALQHPDTS
jgi:hypothetical protein